MEQARHDKILQRIDQTLERYHDERTATIEDTMWAGLSDAVERGWMTQEEADECMQQYVTARNAGQTALGSSDQQ